MTRRRALVVLVLVVGGLVAMSLSTIVAGTTTPPARYAQVSVGKQTLDIWRDAATHDLTFHWDGEDESEASRYIPYQFTLTQLAGGRVVNGKRYASSAAAWSAIHGRFGVTRRQVRAALIAGSPSDLPPTAGVKIPD